MKTEKNYTLITGGSMGIGLELARQFAENGHNLILVARHTNDLENARQALSGYAIDVMTISKDLFDPEAAFSLYDEINNKGLTGFDKIV